MSSVGSRGDSYDNAIAESVIGLFKTDVLRREGPWWNVEDVEFEEQYSRSLTTPAILGSLNVDSLR